MSDSMAMRQTKQLLNEICQTFRDEKNPKNVNMKELREYVKKDKELSEQTIFRKKLDSIKSSQSISQQQFQRLFLPDFNNYEHFSMVFETLDQDKSNKISKRQMESLNRQFSLGLNKKDIEIMFAFVSKDSNIVEKQDLFAFFKNTK